MTKFPAKLFLLTTSVFYFSISSLSFAMEDDQNDYRPAILKESTQNDWDKYKIRQAKILSPTPLTTHSIPTSPVKDQDCLGTCASFSIGGSMESLSDNQSLRVSEAHFTVSAEEKDSDGGKAGFSLALGMAFARDSGLVSQHLWEYDGPTNDFYLRALCDKRNVKYEERWKKENAEKLNNNLIITSPVHEDKVSHFRFKHVKKFTITLGILS